MNEAIWTPGMKLIDLEEQVIKTAMRYYRGNKINVCSCLGISLRTLDNKLKVYKDKDEQAIKDKQKISDALKDASRKAHPSAKSSLVGFSKERENLYPSRPMKDITKHEELKIDDSLKNNRDVNHKFIPGWSKKPEDIKMTKEEFDKIHSKDNSEAKDGDSNGVQVQGSSSDRDQSQAV